jgi:hypothetical protein
MTTKTCEQRSVMKINSNILDQIAVRYNSQCNQESCVCSVRSLIECCILFFTDLSFLSVANGSAQIISMHLP